MHSKVLIFSFLSLLWITVNYSTALTQSQMFPYGPANGDTAEYQSDDGYVKVITTVYFPFFGKQHNELFVDTNGVLTFDAGLSDWNPTAFPLSDNVKIIAPFWADVDCTAGNNGRVFYRQSTDSQLLASGSAQIKNYFGNMQDFQATWMFVATWWNVTYFGGNKNSPTDTFQCALVTDGNDAFAIFNYLQISWTTGISDGGNSSGLGGIPAQVGFDAGDGINYYALPQSRTNDVLYIGSQSNLNPQFPGKFIFQINDVTIHNLPTVTIATCRATTDPHFTTFDGAYYSPQEPPGPWFLAASPVSLPNDTIPWSVWFRTSFWYGNPYATCITSVEIDVAEQIVEFGMNGFLRINGLDVIAPWYYPDSNNASVSVVGYGNDGHLLSTIDMVKVTFTGSNDYTLTIQAPTEIYGNDTEGVCGNMNGNPNDDPTCPDGGPIDTCWQRHNLLSTTENPTTVGPYRTTSTSLETTTSSIQCDPQIERQIKEQCSIIINATGPFKVCITNATSVAEQYFESCVYDLCAASNQTTAFCSLLQSYADACMQEIPSITLNWRSENLCPPNCSAHMHYDNCASSCPATCSNPNAPLTCPLPCRGDCTCDDGYVLDSGKCIDPNQCGCTDNEGYHPYGSHWVTKNCKEQCTCGDNHNITCEQNPPCDAHAKCTVFDGSFICRCLPGYTGNGEECSPIDYCISSPCKNDGTCISQKHGYKCQCPTGYSGTVCQNIKIVTCHANGDPHFTTFDGAYYSPQEPPGLWFLAAQPVVVPNGTLPWSVWFSTHYYYGNHEATCIVNVEIDIAGMVVNFGMNGFFRVNGINRIAPWYYPNKQNPQFWVYNNGWYGHTLGTKDLVTVSFSGATDYSMKIQAPYPVYTNDTEGICGNMNGKQHDDPVCPDGNSINTCWERHYSHSTTMEPTTSRTTENYHTTNAPPTTTEYSPNCEENQLLIDEECFIVLNSTGPFAACVINERELALNYYNSCTYDMCVANQSNAICSLLQSYADACMQAVPNLKLQWRTEDFCLLAPDCPENSHYDDCTSSCPSTCSNPEGPTDCSSTCQGSCTCNTGYVYDGGICILPSDCGCLDVDGYYHQYNSYWVMDGCTLNCTCAANRTSVCVSKTPCDIHAVCEPLDGDESCYCLPGYTGDGENCILIPTTEHFISTQSVYNSTSASNFDCYGKPDGDYPDPNNACSAVWYKCSAGVTYPQMCEEGTVFDSQLDKCVWQNQLPACTITTQLPPTTIRPDITETCRASGDPHFTTFDGEYYSPQPPPGAWFLAAKPVEWPEHTIRWSVWFSTTACSSTVTCIEKLETVIDNQVIDFGMNGFLRINGLDVIAPWYYPNRDNASVWVVNYGSTGHTLSTIDQVSVTFSGTTDYSMTIQVPRDLYFNDTEGYCGNMNDNPNDDPTCPDGGPINTCWERHHKKTTIASTTTHASTEPLTGSTIVGTTSTYLNCDAQTQRQIEQECTVITNSSGPFSPCVENASSLAYDYYMSCVYDLCAYNNPPGAICQILQSYADACMQDLPNVILQWRSEDLCPPNCSANMHYEDCAPSCPATCSDPDGPSHCALPCRGACECNSGYLLDNGECIPTEQCGCRDPEGYYHQVGSQWMYDGCQMLCLCSDNNTIVCVQTTPCDTHAECVARDGQENCYCLPGYTGDGLQCSPVDHCTDEPCEHNGTCINEALSYKCECPSGYNGKNCENKLLTTTVKLESTTMASETIETCRANGDPHFTTFDGAYYSPQPPPGEWNLAAEPVILPEDTIPWSVWFRTTACSSTVTCIVEVRSIVEKQVVDFGMNGFLRVFIVNYPILNYPITNSGYIQVNGLNIIAPWYYPDKINATVWVVNYGTTGHTLTTVEEVSVTFSGSTDYALTIQAPLQLYFNDTEGYCGNMNNDPNDDPICPNGEPINTCWEEHHKSTTYRPTTSIATESTTSFKTTTESPSCNAQSQQQIEQQCSIITNVDGPFAVCAINDSALAQDYFNSCVFDLCAYNSNETTVLCSILQSYADACMQDLPNVVINWRNQSYCPPNCSENMHYEDCASSCPATCSDPNAPSKCSLPCRGDCICNSGYLFDNGQCVNSDDCGCVDSDGLYHQENTQWVINDCQEQCTCGYNHSVICEPKIPCDAHADCIIYEGNENCRCLPGYTGDGEICREIDYCTSSPCKNGGTCVQQVGGYTCNCPRGYGGSNCEDHVTTIPTTLSFTTTSFSGVFNCTGKPNGNYANPASSCSNVFYTCSNGIAYERNCEANLVYDSAIDECVYPIQLPACGITSTHSPISTTPAGFTCNGKPDGNYGDPKTPCSNEFYTCYKGRKVPRHCQSGMVFDPIKHVCVYPSDLPACTATTNVVYTTETIPQTTGSGPFNCVGKQDGNYPDPSNQCSNIFYTCSNGIPYQRNCEPGLVYDADKDQCVYPYQLPICGVTTQLYRSPTTSQPAYFNCTGKPNGNYADPTNPCTSKFYMCSEGHTIQEHCDFGLVFDPLTGNCQIPSVVPGCQLSTSESPLSSTQSAGTFNCTNMANGDYANPEDPCSNVFYTCSNGMTYTQHCATPYLVFDQSRDQCVYQYQLPACYHFTVASHAETTPTKHASTKQPPTGFNCTGKPNGDYANPSNPCSDVYYTCSNGFSSQQQCPANLVFDQSMDECVNTYQLPACQVDQPTTERGLTTASTTAFNCTNKPNGDYTNPVNNCSNIFYTCSKGISYQEQCAEPYLVFDQALDDCVYPYQLPACQASFDCSDQQDGNYPDPNDPCSHYFWYCSNGIAYKMECPRNLVYDAYDNHCTYPYNLPACNSGMTTPLSSTTVSVAVTTAPFVNYNCTGKSDGNYADPDNPCSHYYYTCSDGQASESQCPDNLIFDPEEDHCVSESSVPACQGSTAFSTLETTYTQTIQISSSSSASTGTSACVNSVVFNCKTLGNGAYVHPMNPCSTWYLQCTFGYVRAMNCPQDLYFDIYSSKCLDKDLVLACV